MKLSDAFENTEFFGVSEKETPALELEVKVLNINEGKNRHIAEKCRTLAHYSALIAKIREFEKEGFILEEAAEKAVIYCCDHDILREFLEKNASEILNMLMTEWNWDDALAVRYEEGREEGLEKGRGEGREEGRKEERIEIACRMKACGLSITEIVDYSGLSPEVVERL